MALLVHSMVLLVLAAFVAATTPPPAPTCPTRLFRLQVWSAKNSTGHENVKARLIQPEGSSWQLPIQAVEEAATGDGGSRCVITIALSAEADETGEEEGEDKGVCRRLREQDARIADLQWSNAALQQRLVVVEATLRKDGVKTTSTTTTTPTTTPTTAPESVPAPTPAAPTITELQRHLDALTSAIQESNPRLGAAFLRHLKGVTPAPGTAGNSTAAPTTATPPRQLTFGERAALSIKLFEAAKSGRVEEMRQVIAEGADVRHQECKGMTPLHEAALAGHLDAVRLLLDKGSPVDIFSINRHTPLQWAAYNGHAFNVEALLAAGADIDHQDHVGYTPLHWAATNNHEDAVRVLVAAGANLTLRNNKDQTAREITGSESIRALLSS